MLKIQPVGVGSAGDRFWYEWGINVIIAEKSTMAFRNVLVDGIEHRVGHYLTPMRDGIFDSILYHQP